VPCKYVRTKRKFVYTTFRVHLFKTQVAVNEIITRNARRVNALSNENCSNSFALFVKLKTTLFTGLLSTLR